MSKTWIVVAESSRAKIYEVEQNESKKSLKEITGFTHSIVRSHKQHLPSHRRKENRHSQLSGTFNTYKDHERTVFAQTLGSHLNAARNKGQFNKLILMSPPKFLGDLRKKLNRETNRFVVSEIDKNLVRHNIKDIQAHIPKWY